MKKLVSIIIPVYNTEKTVAACLESVLGQTYGSFEAIVVDDGSTDGATAICDAYGRKDARIKVIHRQNGGLSAARNAGLASAAGEYITFLDSDDLMSPTKLELMIGAMERYGADMSCCDVHAFRAEEHFEMSSYMGEADVPPVVSGREEAVWLFTRAFTGPVTWVWNKIYTRQLIGDTVFDTAVDIAEDTVFNAQIMAKLDKMVYIPQKLQHYYQRPGSQMNTGSGRIYLALGQAQLREYRLLEKTGGEPFQEVHLYSCLSKLALLETQAHFDKNKAVAQQLVQLYRQLLAENAGRMKSGKERAKTFCFLHMRALFHALKRKWYVAEEQRKAL